MNTTSFPCDANRNVISNWERNHAVSSLSLLDFISALKNLFCVNVVIFLPLV